MKIIMTNRQTGLICSFYSDTQKGVENTLELAIRAGFRKIGEGKGVAHEFGNLKKISDAELYGAGIFKKRFSKGQTHIGALDLITELRLAKNRDEAEKMLDYMVQNDMPYLKRSLIASSWGRFTLVPDKNQERYVVEGYRTTIEDFLFSRTWDNF